MLYIHYLCFKAVHSKHFLDQFISPTKCTVLIIYKYLRHVVAQVYHLQGDQNASFKNRLLLESRYEVLQSVMSFLLM